MSRCKRSLLKRLRSLLKRLRSIATRGVSPAGDAAEPNGLGQGIGRGNAAGERAWNLRERLAQMSPVERGPGVGLAARGNVDMSDDIDDRISPAQSDE